MKLKLKAAPASWPPYKKPSHRNESRKKSNFAFAFDAITAVRKIKERSYDSDEAILDRTTDSSKRHEPKHNNDTAFVQVALIASLKNTLVKGKRSRLTLRHSIISPLVRADSRERTM